MVNFGATGCVYDGGSMLSIFRTSLIVNFLVVCFWYVLGLYVCPSDVLDYQ